MTKILDTTLRDGSYVVDFQFTAKDTAQIAFALDQNQIPYIEVGHGVGLNGGNNPKMKSACTDDEYMEAAAGAVKNGKWGMFFIPGIGKLADIDMCSRHSMDFIRIGTNVNELEEAEKYIYRAKELGMMVSSNFMKTYALTADEVGKKAEQAQKYGADIVSIVDSAGGMFPEDVENYFKAVRHYSDVPLGYHGHNNMGLAVACSLKAVELGAAIVDTSLRGIGRSAGNASTEMVLFALKRRGFDSEIDPLQLMDIAEQYIDPVLQNRLQNDSFSIVSGYAQFHSSFLGAIFDYAKRYNVDPRELIIKISQIDKVNLPEELLERMAQQLALTRKPIYNNRHYILTENRLEDGETPAKLATKVCQETQAIAKKMKHLAVFNLVQSIRNSKYNLVSRVINDGDRYTIASAEFSSPEIAKQVAEIASNLVDYILLDCDQKSEESKDFIRQIKNVVAPQKLLVYSDLQCGAKSIVDFIQAKYASLLDISIQFVGISLLADQCRKLLEIYGAKVSINPSICSENSQVIVFCGASDLQKASIEPEQLIIDGFIGSLTQSQIKDLFDQGVYVYRPDMKIALHNEIASVHGMRELVTKATGISQIQDIAIAAGGLVAPRGTVIVDSVSTPKRVYGIADGTGFLLPNAELEEEMKIVRNTIEAHIFYTRGLH